MSVPAGRMSVPNQQMLGIEEKILRFCTKILTPPSHLLKERGIVVFWRGRVVLWRGVWMSSINNPRLLVIATKLCRELRKNSTSAEKLFWTRVRNRRFLNKKINRQFPIFFDLHGKESFFVADFFCVQENLVIEIDGGYHERQKEHDALRDHIINSLGISVVRFTNKQVEFEMEECLLELAKVFKSHDSRPFSWEEKGEG